MKIRKLKRTHIQTVEGKRGFTLVELILGMGLLTILLGILLNVFVSSVELKLESEADSALTNDARFIVNRINLDVRDAKAIIEPSMPNGTSQTLIININDVLVEYRVDEAGRLIRIQGADSQLVTSSATRVEAINFTSIGEVGGRNNIQISLNLEAVTQTVRGAENFELEYVIGTRL